MLQIMSMSKQKGTNKAKHRVQPNTLKSRLHIAARLAKKLLLRAASKGMRQAPTFEPKITAQANEAGIQPLIHMSNAKTNVALDVRTITVRNMPNKVKISTEP